MAPTIENGTHVRLNDGRLMPLLGLGCWQGKSEEMANAVESALKAGYRHIDTAYNYLNEEAVGEGIRQWGGDRKDLFVVTKLPLHAMSGGSVERFLKLSLAKLQLDYVDLYLIHCPIGLKYIDDNNTFPLGEDGNLVMDYGTNHIALWKEMEAVRAAGLAKSIGVSNFSVAQLRRLMATSTVPPAVNQVEMNVEFQQREMKQYCDEAGIGITSYGSLGSPGRRGTPFEAGCVIPRLLEHPVVCLVATGRQVTPAQVLLRFLLQQGVVVIPKSVTPSRIAENGKILSWSLTELEMNALRTLDMGEKGRSFNFLRRKGMELHPECPVLALP